MEIYDFINSYDIKEHWEKLDYQPTALESAWLVWQSKNHTLEEKHMAWRNILDNSEDCLISKVRFNLPQRWLHHFLRRYMKIEKYLIAEFYREEPNSVYSYRIYYSDSYRGEWCEDWSLYSSFNEAYNEVCVETQCAFFEIIKTYLGKEGKQLLVRFNPEKEIVRVDENHYVTDENGYEIFNEVFENMWFSFPTPFKKGDIVKTVLGKYARPTTFADLFVLTSICTEVERPMTDGSDMTAHGYFIDRDGVVYHECIHNYMDLEYVKTPLADENKLLLPISKYLKEEIDLGLLLGTYRNILCKNEANEVYLSLNYTKEGKELAGMEK